MKLEEHLQQPRPARCWACNTLPQDVLDQIAAATVGDRLIQRWLRDEGFDATDSKIASHRRHA